MAETVDLSHIEVVALDFDGTLLDPGLTILPQVIEAIGRATEAGVRVVTASGRSVGSQRLILDEHGLTAESGLIAALSVDERKNWLLQDGDYVPQPGWNARMDEEWARLKPVAVDLMEAAIADLLAQDVWAEPSIPENMVDERGLVGLRLEGEAEAVARRDWVRDRVDAATDELQVTQNWHLIHILLSSAGKGHTLAALANHWKLPPAAILAVGDRNNDVPMLDGSAGLTPAAVGNAVPEIKELVTANGGVIAEGAMGRGVAELLDRVVAARAAS